MTDLQHPSSTVSHLWVYTVVAYTTLSDVHHLCTADSTGKLPFDTKFAC